MFPRTHDRPSGMPGLPKSRILPVVVLTGCLVAANNAVAHYEDELLDWYKNRVWVDVFLMCPLFYTLWSDSGVQRLRDGLFSLGYALAFLLITMEGIDQFRHMMEDRENLDALYRHHEWLVATVLLIKWWATLLEKLLRFCSRRFFADRVNGQVLALVPKLECDLVLGFLILRTTYRTASFYIIVCIQAGWTLLRNTGMISVLCCRVMLVVWSMLGKPRCLPCPTLDEAFVRRTAERSIVDLYRKMCVTVVIPLLLLYEHGVLALVGHGRGSSCLLTCNETLYSGVEDAVVSYVVYAVVYGATFYASFYHIRRQLHRHQLSLRLILRQQYTGMKRYTYLAIYLCVYVSVSGSYYVLHGYT